MSFGGIKLSDKVQVIQAFASTAAPSTASPRWISLKDVKSLQVVVTGLNGTTVTGSAVALSQATAVAGTSAKTLSFTAMLANTDLNTNGQASWTNTAVASNTFTTTTTNSKYFQYVIDVDPASLDTNNSFDCVRVTLGDAANCNVSALYIVEHKYGGNALASAAVTSD